MTGGLLLLFACSAVAGAASSLLPSFNCSGVAGSVGLFLRSLACSAAASTASASAPSSLSTICSRTWGCKSAPTRIMKSPSGCSRLLRWLA
ncbi:uncharacterized protein BCR38DRAFT_448032 [Pseudomassariella vexata]|uniref:Hydrophobin n=1 Tax=Pseudomassariella vexata TaxID=1141098 RepID=A0A1Y2DFN7_9PEZI|nr:uncharacterized protein BCR38DRAFT_448032 [Pseudomassariella vexata]ORY58103.1 hypothetical protein BCR38DRAFT_448032 [Pseudomassariella vexata]